MCFSLIYYKILWGVFFMSKKEEKSLKTELVKDNALLKEIDFPLKLNMKRDEVSILHDALRAIGYEIKDTEKANNRFGVLTHQAVLDFQEKNNLEASGEVDEKTASLLLKEAGLHKCVVHGIVQDQNGEPQSGLNVKAFDCNIGMDDTLIGHHATDDQGNYSISYPLSKLHGKTAADLAISVYQKDRLLQEADVIFNAKPDETKDFTVTLDESPEFKLLSEKIRPLLHKKVELIDLKKDQIDFLSQKTDIEARKIEWLSQSHELSGGDEKPAISNSVNLFSAKHDFPENWHQFMNPPQGATGQILEINLKPEMFPFMLREKEKAINKIDIFVKTKDEEANAQLSGTSLILNQDASNQITLKTDTKYNGILSAAKDGLELNSDNPVTLKVNGTTLNSENVDDLFIAFTYTLSED